MKIENHIFVYLFAFVFFTKQSIDINTSLIDLL